MSCLLVKRSYDSLQLIVMVMGKLATSMEPQRRKRARNNNNKQIILKNLLKLMPDETGDFLALSDEEGITVLL